MEGKFPIDASGQLPDGRRFTGPGELRDILSADREAFGRAITSKLLTYGLGRGLERYDNRTVKLIASRLPTYDYRFSGLVLEIVNSLPFQSAGDRQTRITPSLLLMPAARPSSEVSRQIKERSAMIVTRKHLHRRTFLKGMGAAVALPLLDAMTPALSAVTRTAKAPLRMAFTYVPNGIVMSDWTPTAAGRAFEYSRIMKPLEKFREDTIVLSGLAHRNGYALGDGPGDHARAGASYLTGVHPKKTAGADIQNGISVDQIAAQQLGTDTRFGSLEIGCDDSRTVGNCDSGYSCAYTNSLAWLGPATPMPPETNPRLVFERLFGDIDTSLAPEVRARRLSYRRSILDLVGERTTELSASLGPADKRKLDEYLTSIRDRAAHRARREGHDRPRPDHRQADGHPGALRGLREPDVRPPDPGVPDRLDPDRHDDDGPRGQHADVSGINVPDPHHPLTTTATQLIERSRESLHTVFSGFIQKWDTPDGDGSLLDRSTIIYDSGLVTQPPHARGSARADARWWRRVPPREPHRLSEGYADDQPLPDNARSHGRAGGQDRRQHGPD
jgi:hypothetical protein